MPNDRVTPEEEAKAMRRVLARELPVSLRKLDAIQRLVDEQAEDEALWATNLDGKVPISEAYLQQELRRLHALIEDVIATTPRQGEER